MSEIIVCCPECGSSVFDQFRQVEQEVEVAFKDDGVTEEELMSSDICDSDEFQCSECGWSARDEDGDLIYDEEQFRQWASRHQDELREAQLLAIA